MKDTPADNAAIQPSEGSDTQQTKQPEVNWEKRYKDTQSAYTKTRQELVELKAHVDVLKSQGMTPVQIDATLKEELEDLKYSNPEEWRRKMNQIETESHSKISSAVADKVREYSELEQRQAMLEAFKESHPGFELTDDDVPPRIAKKLASGSIRFDEFLNEVYEYVTTPRVVGTPNKTLDQPDLGKAGGGATPSLYAEVQDITKSYKNEVY